MKTRILSLFLIAALLVGMLAMPASAATKKDVYQWLKSQALNGYNDTENGYYYVGLFVDSENAIYFGDYYYPSDGKIELALVTDNFEVTLVLTSSMSTPYTAYVNYYGVAMGKAKVYPSSYVPTTKLTFSEYKAYVSGVDKSQLLALLNDVFPLVLELTGWLIWNNSYRLADLGFTKYESAVTDHQIHLYDDGTVTKQPTCGEQGTMTYTCVVCKDTYSDIIPATGNHSWNAGKVTTKPTCTEPGVKTFTCTVCSQQKTEPVAAKGHYWEVTEILTPATEDEHGTAKYTCKTCGATKEAVLCASEIFIDTPAEGHWAHTPIDWAFFGGITTGTKANLFSPDKTCTRDQVVTFLWRANGCPEPASTENPFKDVPADAYYTKAVLWAVENGITNGKSKTKFGVGDPCTRGQVVTFLWRAKGCPEPESEENPFKDVSEDDYFYKAVLWAVEKGVTNGTSKTKFSPANTCTRAQVVTFLYRAAQLPDPDPDPNPDPDPDPEPNPENP